MTRTCMDCDQPVAWVRYTQFAGNHPYCDEHAKLQQDFGTNDSYLYWKELKMTNENIDRIEQLAINLVLYGEDPDGDVDDMYIPVEFTRKFAELLIRECARIADENFNNGFCPVGHFIQEHFGVK
jgi:hypothetical protein